MKKRKQVRVILCLRSLRSTDPETGGFSYNASVRLAAMSPLFGLKKEYHEPKNQSARITEF